MGIGELLEAEQLIKEWKILNEKITTIRKKTEAQGCGFFKNGICSNRDSNKPFSRLCYFCETIIKISDEVLK